MMNRVTIQGNIGSIEEFDANGTEGLKISVCNNDSYKNKQGEWIETPMWFKVIKWFPTDTQKELKKGDMIVVEGKLKSRDYDNKNGDKVNVVEIIVFSIVKGEKKKANFLGMDEPPF